MAKSRYFLRLLLLCSPFSHGQIMHLVYPPKFGITFVSNFSWILQSSQWFCKILGGKQSTLWFMRKCWVQLLSSEVWWKKLLIFFLGINRYLGNHSDFNWQTAGSRPHVSFLIWKRRFFYQRFDVPSTRIRWKRSRKTHLFKNALQSGDFGKRWKRRFSNTTMSFIIYYQHYAYSVRDVIVFP